MSCQKPGVTACRPVEHPGRHFKPPICLRLFERAAEDDKTILVDGTTNANSSTKPRMMPIRNLAKNGPVGVLKPRCTTPRAHIVTEQGCPGPSRRRVGRGRSSAARSWADCTVNMAGSDLRQAHAPHRRPPDVSDLDRPGVPVETHYFTCRLYLIRHSCHQYLKCSHSILVGYRDFRFSVHTGKISSPVSSSVVPLQLAKIYQTRHHYFDCRPLGWSLLGDLRTLKGCWYAGSDNDVGYLWPGPGALSIEAKFPSDAALERLLRQAAGVLEPRYPKTAESCAHAPIAERPMLYCGSRLDQERRLEMPTIKPLLNKLNRFYTRSADEARAFLGTKDYEVDFPRRDAGQQLDLRVNGAYLPGTYVGYYQFGTPIVARTDAGRHDYWINLPLAEPIEATIGAETIIGDRKRGFIASPSLQYAVRTQGAGARLHVQITEERLNQQVAALLGEAPVEPIAFAAAIDLTTGYGRSIACCVMQAVNHLQQDDMFPGNKVTAGLFEDLIISRLLLSHPSNYSKALGRLEAKVAPATIRRAVDFMQARLGEPLALADIAMAAGIPGRTLFTHFQCVHGTSPMQFLRRLRFEKVREALLHARQTDNVSSICGRWGFTHLGRFAVEYRHRFGETPSQTLAHARRG
jgi:AraC-like DNA-binding protein